MYGDIKSNFSGKSSSSLPMGGLPKSKFGHATPRTRGNVTSFPAVGSSSRPQSRAGGPSRGVKRDIERLWETVHQQQVIIERQNQEIERIQRMVEPMSDVLKRYCDQAERRMCKKVDKASSDQIKTNTRIDNAIAALRRAKASTDEKTRVFQEQVAMLSSQLQFLNEEIFGDPNGGMAEAQEEEGSDANAQ